MTKMINLMLGGVRLKIVFVIIELVAFLKKAALCSTHCDVQFSQNPNVDAQNKLCEYENRRLHCLIIKIQRWFS